MKVTDYLAEELKLEAIGAAKETIARFGKFYPKTLQAFGGPKGLQKWLAGDDCVPVRVARVLQAENNRVCVVHEEFEELNGIEFFKVLFDAMPSIT